MELRRQKFSKIILCGFFALIFAVIGTNPTHALDVVQQDLVVSSHSPTITINDTGITPGKDFQITPKLEFNKLDDFITYRLTLQNNDGKRYKIVEVKDNNTNDAIELAYAYPTILDTTDKTLEFAIKYVKKSATPLQTVTATISLVDEDDQSQQITLTVPNTGTNTITDRTSAIFQRSFIIYLILATIIAAAYTIIRRRQTKNNKRTNPKRSKTLLAITLALALIPSIVIVATSKDLQFIIEFSNIQLNGPYTVTFNTNGGQPVPQDQTINHNEQAQKPTTDPQKTGYTFSKWLNGTTEYIFTTPVTGDLNLTAEYTSIPYSINYDLAGGTEPTPANPTSYTIESNDITLTNPTRDHYDFAGWITPTDNTPHLTVTIQSGSTGDKSYIATWTEKEYTVSFDANGGSPTPQPQTIKYQQFATEPTTKPTKTGYTFKSWQLNNADFNFATTSISGDITLTVAYTLDTYTINYDLAGGTEPTPANPTRYTYEDNDITLTNPTKDHYDFAGWITPTDNTPRLTVTIPKKSTGDKSYIATWTEKEYTVSFDANGGQNAPASQKVKYQQYATKPTTNPSKNGYNFKGWQLNNADYNFTTTEITGDITLTANYEAIKYTMNYNLDGGTEGTPANPTEYTIESANIILTSPTKTGHTFTGWTGEGITTPTKDLTIQSGSAGNRTYTANWQINSYTVTYITDGGTPVPPQETKNYKEKFTQPTTNPSKTGHTFVRWLDENDQPYNFNTEVTRNLTLKAEWRVVGYTVRFRPNSGSGSMPDQKIPTGVSTPLNANTFTRANYTFDSWNTRSDGTGTKYTDKESVLNLAATNTTTTLYAIWKPDTYQIVYDGNKGNGSSDVTGTTANSTVSYNTAHTLNANGYSRTGYTFKGWSRSSTATTPTYTDAQTLTTSQVGNLTDGLSNGDSVTLYAVWQANTYTLVFDPLDGYYYSGNTKKYDSFSSTVQYDTQSLIVPTAYHEYLGSSSVIDEAAVYWFGYTGQTKIVSENWSHNEHIISNIGGKKLNSLLEDLPAGGSKILYAQYNCAEGHVCYHDNGSTSSFTMGSVPYHKFGQDTSIGGIRYQLMLFAPNFYKTGYGFAGWNTEPNGGGTNYGPNQTIIHGSHLTGRTEKSYYANWVKSVGDMQTWDGCASLAVNEVTALTDTRDGNTYAIAKLADNKCWMIENLRLGSNTPITLTPEDTNITTDFILPASIGQYEQGFSGITQSAFNIINPPEHYETQSSLSDYLGNARYSRTTNYSHGVFYSNQAGQSVCPKGWRLPTGGASGEFVALDIALGGTGGTQNLISPRILSNPYITTHWTNYPQNFVYSNALSSTYGSWHTSPDSFASYLGTGGTFSFGIHISSNFIYMINPSSSSINNFSVRCIKD